MNPQLVAKLQSEAFEAERFILHSPLPDSIEAIKTLTEKKLLSLTPKAVDILEEVADTGAPKERLQAACAILDRSPATSKQDLLSPSDQSFPLEAFKLLVEGMGKMFGSSLKTLQPVEQPETILVRSHEELEPTDEN